LNENSIEEIAKKSKTIKNNKKDAIKEVAPKTPKVSKKKSINSSNIVTDNGVIHVIDTLLTLPLPLPERNTPFPSATAFNDKSEMPTITVTITVIIFYFIKLKSSRRK
jgi:hypothetical protein